MLALVFLILKILGVILLILLGMILLILVIPVGIRGEIARRHPALYAKVGPVEVKVYPFPPEKEKQGKKEKKNKPSQNETNEDTPPGTGGKNGKNSPKPPEKQEKPQALPASLALPKTSRESIKKPPEPGDKTKTEPETTAAPEKGVKDLPWDLIRRLLGMAGPIIQKVLRAVRIYDLELVLPVHGRDAADTAITYGRVSALVYGTLTLVQNLCRFQAKRIRLEPDFTGEQGEIEYFSCKITTHLFIIVVIILWVLFRLKWPKDD